MPRRILHQDLPHRPLHAPLYVVVAWNRVSRVSIRIVNHSFFEEGTVDRRSEHLVSVFDEVEVDHVVEVELHGFAGYRPDLYRLYLEIASMDRGDRRQRDMSKPREPPGFMDL